MFRLSSLDSPFNRRDVLKLGGVFGGLAWPALFHGSAFGAAKPSALTGKSVIFLFLHGGPSQYETFDPKMTAPSGIHSVTGEIATQVPGLTLGGSFPKLARLADRFSIVRSFATGDGNHDIKPVVGKDSLGANLGSLFSRVAGANRPDSGMPTNAALFPQAVDPTTNPAVRDFGKFESTGNLGSAFAPFVPGAEGDVQKNLKLSLALDRLDDRRSLLGSLDRFRWDVDSVSASSEWMAMRNQAFQTILGGVSNAFDLSKEDPATIARYDTAPLVRPEAIDKKWKNYERYVDNAKSLGKLLLLARRLCEAGTGFVTVTTNFVWDMHADVNNAGVEEGMRYTGLPLDHALSAFLEDLESRGLSDKILLVCCGEMGRTPRINKNGGRDHWGNLAPLLLAGGGLKTGQVIGQSSRDGSEPASSPVRIPNLNATIFQTLFDVSELRLTRGIPNDIIRLASESPIPGLA